MFRIVQLFIQCNSQEFKLWTGSSSFSLNVNRFSCFQLFFLFFSEALLCICHNYLSESCPCTMWIFSFLSHSVFVQHLLQILLWPIIGDHQHTLTSFSSTLRVRSFAKIFHKRRPNDDPCSI